MIGNTLCQLVAREDSTFALQCSLLGQCLEQTFTLNPQHRYLLGRAPEDKLGLVGIGLKEDKQISAAHAVLKYAEIGNKWEIYDNNSCNGVYVKLDKGDQEVQFEQLLRLGKDTYAYATLDDPCS